MKGLELKETFSEMGVEQDDERRALSLGRIEQHNLQSYVCFE